MAETMLLNTASNGLPPAAPVPTTAATGGTVADGVYGVKVTYVTATGETVGSVNGPVTTAGGGFSTITIPSPTAIPTATGWYAYITQVGGSTFTRQQASGSPTAVGTALTLTAPPTSNGAQPPPTAGATGTTLDFGSGNTMTRVAAMMTCDPTVLTATITINGAADGSTMVPIVTFTGGLRCSAVWFNPDIHVPGVQRGPHQLHRHRERVRAGRFPWRCVSVQRRRLYRHVLS